MMATPTFPTLLQDFFHCPPLRPSHFVEVLSRVQASLDPLAAGAALTRPRDFTRRAFIEASGHLEERRTP